MEIKTAIFLVESPMQLINAIEAKHYFNVQKSILLIRYDGIAANDNHIDYVLDTIDNNFSHIIKIMLLYGKKSIIKMMAPVRECIRYNPDCLFIGNYFSGYAKPTRFFYPNKKTIFLDDGAQTTKLYYDNKKINIFSYYKFNEVFKGRLYIHHRFDYTRFRLLEKKQEIADNTIFFIGAALVENNLITISNYEKVLSSLIENYKQYRIKYFPHRFEDLSKLRKVPNFEIVTIEMPIELYLLQAKVLPQKVISFYSAALYTINSIFGDTIKVEAFKIPPVLFINSQYADKIGRLYDYYSQSMSVIESNEEI